MEERLQKILSSAGLCSRRTAEVWLSQGKVTVNGKVAEIGQKADPEKDSIRVDGKLIDQTPEMICLMLHKPRGYVTTLSDERGRPTVAQLVADCGQRVYPIGRLDLHSEGLLLLTNNGDLAHKILHPRHMISKTYRITVSGELRGCAERLGALEALEDGDPIVPAQVTLLRKKEEKAVLEVVIHQGKNRQIRRMCAMVGLKVHRLVRLKEGNLALGNLPVGKWRMLTPKEIAELTSE